jgi:hypothetical protein
VKNARIAERKRPYLRQACCGESIAGRLAGIQYRDELCRRYRCSGFYGASIAATGDPQALSISACRKAMMFAWGRMAEKASGKSALVTK